MLGVALILPAIFVSALASGEFSVLVSPKSLAFKGNEKLNSAYLSDVFAASLGRTVSGDADWSGLYITDPFALPDTAVAVIVDGVNHVKVNAKTKTYPLFGTDPENSLNSLPSMMQVADVDLNEGVDKVYQFDEIFGTIEIANILKETSNLKPQLHSEDKLFLQQIAVLDKLAKNLVSNEKLPEMLIIRISLTPIQAAHGENSPAAAEAEQLLSDAIQKLGESLQSRRQDDTLGTVIASKNDMLLRSKRQAKEGPAKLNITDLNLASYYDEDYPVIFNIILWFMVVLFFSLLAISYAIATMDPGRDSIIYRMTSTRMKKDN